MQITRGYNINLDEERNTRVRVVPHQEFPNEMPTYEIVSHRTGLTLHTDLTLVEVRRIMQDNGWELVVPE